MSLFASNWVAFCNVLTSDSSQSASQGVVESILELKSWEGKEVGCFVRNVREFPAFQLMEILWRWFTRMSAKDMH